uniref:Uncharacterized protein n=1 Tax=Chromera velia CCMP2878 TaxID=1169474 RepID=A0A0G4G5D8_9ALVE|eukprot:Cvel_20335.t1-p1 / transcript=Cvel_20335.t1 / gene=Cvel_20335 / organism=Chromera_velia_CCMP2878 / gene_product=hypothetical protein / transcript_product=hypothetical protein / location=Cvel_scaffold1816:34426-36333(-) / protein_length=260 / sequence_SO=supercontig / SO=protein_coding / is_pseudo=false
MYYDSGCIYPKPTVSEHWQEGLCYATYTDVPLGYEVLVERRADAGYFLVNLRTFTDACISLNFNRLYNSTDCVNLPWSSGTWVKMQGRERVVSCLDDSCSPQVGVVHSQWYNSSGCSDDVDVSRQSIYPVDGLCLLRQTAAGTVDSVSYSAVLEKGVYERMTISKWTNMTNCREAATRSVEVVLEQCYKYVSTSGLADSSFWYEIPGNIPSGATSESADGDSTSGTVRTQGGIDSGSLFAVFAFLLVMRESRPGASTSLR